MGREGPDRFVVKRVKGNNKPDHLSVLGYQTTTYLWRHGAGGNLFLNGSIDGACSEVAYEDEKDFVLDFRCMGYAGTAIILQALADYYRLTVDVKDSYYASLPHKFYPQCENKTEALDVLKECISDMLPPDKQKGLPLIEELVDLIKNDPGGRAGVAAE